jgi:hypothetical protein
MCLRKIPFCGGFEIYAVFRISVTGTIMVLRMGGIYVIHIEEVEKG